MKTGKDLLAFGRKYIGSKYVFGAFVPKNLQNYKGAFDCAEFISYTIFQLTGHLYGCDKSDPAQAAKADAYTGYFARDLDKGLFIKISVADAARIPGAILLRRPTGAAIGHIAFSKGDGKTLEAHSTKYGVIESVVNGRRWSDAFLLKEVNYKEEAPVATKAPAVVYRLKSPYMKDPFIGTLQRKLKECGFDPKGIDDKYGPGTQAAVVAFQKKAGLVADGEVMPGGETARALGIS